MSVPTRPHPVEASAGELPEGLSAHRLDHAGLSTFFLRSGIGTGPPVLLLHGSGPGVSGLANWRATMTSALAHAHRFVAPDLLGFGQTYASAPGPRDPDTLTHQARVRQVVAFAEAYGEAPYDVVGNSMGGALALALAAARPDLVRRMVLMGTVGIDFPLTPALDRVWGYTPSLANMRVILELFAYNQGLITDQLVRLRYAASADPDAHRRYATAFAPPRQRHINEMTLPAERLRAITAPVLLVHGAHDRVIPVDQTSRRLVELLPAADLVVFGRCGHWTQIERATDFQRQVGLFFADRRSD